MRKIFISAMILFIGLSLKAQDQLVGDFLKKYKSAYQDIVVHGKTILRGSNICPCRYEIIKSVLEKYKDQQFSVLDIGSAQGYFDFTIAHHYKNAHCTMIESNPRATSMLLDLCNINRYLPHMTVLTKKIETEDLIFLERKEHFDVVLALVVMHMIKGREKVGYAPLIETIMNLGNDVIIEVPFPGYRFEEAEKILQKYDPIYLGTFKRTYSSSHAYGKMYWFKRKQKKSSLDVSEATYQTFIGAYRS